MCLMPHHWKWKTSYYNLEYVSLIPDHWKWRTSYYNLDGKISLT